MSLPVILLVDDEPDLLQIMHASLSMSLPEYAVRSAANFDEAVDCVERLEAQGGELALAVVDHVLGGDTGLEFIQMLNARHPKVPTMMFTGQAAQGVEKRAVEAGAKVVWKPIPLAKLMGEVQQILGC
jgi:CheY-like chemotaxis protein